MNKSEVRNEILNDLLEDHCGNAGRKHDYYQKCLDKACHQDDFRQYVVFDSAEKVLLPHLIQPPGHLNFLIILKFELLRVHGSSSTCLEYMTPAHLLQLSTRGQWV